MPEPASRTYLYRWGLLIGKHRWAALILPILLCLVLVPLALRVTDQLSSGGWLPPDTDAARVDHLLKQEFGRQTISNYLLFSDPTGRLKATDPDFRREVERVVKPLREDSAFTAVYTWGTTSNRDLNTALISDDGTMSLAVVSLQNGIHEATNDFAQFSTRVHSDLLDIRIGGWPATTSALQQMTSSDLARAERISVPITLVLLVIIYGGILAATLPVALAASAIVIALATLAIVSRFMESSIFAVNAVTMLGLAVGIDYALMLISRFREELRDHAPETALANAVATAGRAILVAGAAVTIGLAGLIAFRVPAAISTGLAGASVVAASVLLALTSLPAALLLLHRRIGERPGYLRWTARAGSSRLVAGVSRVQRGLQRHAMLAALACAAALILLTLPVFDMKGASPSMAILPRTTEARQLYDQVAAHFPNASLTPVTIIVQPREGRMTSSTNLDHLRDFTSEIAAMPGVTGVDSLWSFIPDGMGAFALSSSLTLDRSLQETARPYITPRAAVIQISMASDADAGSQAAFVRQMRDNGMQMSGNAFTVLVGGESATSVDLVAMVQDRAPAAVAVVVIATWIVLFLQFQSVLLPLKAIALNLLSISASFGALVWIFQEGHLSNLLAFEPTGTTIIIVPILMFCFMFGLSMDYEVIMLSRIREAWKETGDNEAAVQIGLRQAAGIVTSAAAVMLVVFVAFGTSQLLIIKALGIGLGLAVLIDATIIRLILLPATMQLMGDWNWWRPAFTRSAASTVSTATPEEKGSA